MSERLTDEQLAAIRARAEAATPGPWHVPGGDDGGADWVDKANGDMVCQCTSYRNAPFIAHAREDIPALLAHIDGLQAEIDRWHAEWHEKQWFVPWMRERD